MGIELEREVIALSVRGLLAAPVALAIPSDAFTGASRLLAWVCVCRVLRGCVIAWPPISGPLVPEELLARCPAAVRDAVWDRLANPVHETIEAAREEVRGLGQKLLRMRLRRPMVADPFLQVRLMLVSMPRLELPLPVWSELMAETQSELDACERIDTLDPSAARRLVEGLEDVGRE